MSSSTGKARQRQLARAKYERQLARRAASARRRRQLLAGLAVLVLVVAGFAAAWLFGVFDADESQAGDPQPDSSSSSSAESTPTGDDQG